MSSKDDTIPETKALKKRSTPAIVPLLLAGLFMVTGICGLLIIGREKARILGQTVTELDIQPLLNADLPITDADMRGKVVVLHFWGWWCQPCLKELPDFIKTHRAYQQDNEVVIASIACSELSTDTKDTLRFYTNKTLLNYDGSDLPIYSDPAEFSRARISQLMTAGGFSYPTTLVIDGSGSVVDVWRSAVPQTTLTKAIEKAKLANKAKLSKP